MPVHIGVPKVTLRVSEVSSIDDCRRQWLWSRKWASSDQMPGAWTGTFGHKGLEIYYKTHRDPHAVIDHWPRESMQLYEELRNQHPRAEIDTLWSCKEKAFEYVKHYVQYDQLVPLDGKIYGVERRLVMPLLNPETKEPHPRLELSGKVDLALDHRGIPVVVDHKFFADSTFQRLGKLENLVLIDAQLTGYAYLWWRETGVVPKRVILNLILKKMPEPPPSLQRGGLSKARSLSTTGALYRQAVEEQGLDLDQYEEIIQFYNNLGYSQYFMRFEAARNLKQLLAYENMIWQVGQNVASILADSRLAYPSASIYKCGNCPFTQACYETDTGGDVESYLNQLPLADWDSSL